MQQAAHDSTLLCSALFCSALPCPTMLRHATLRYTVTSLPSMICIAWVFRDAVFQDAGFEINRSTPHPYQL